MEKENTSGRSEASPKRNREMKMDPPSTSKTSTDATTFLDLNDDCLYKMYEHLDLPSLCSVADTCIRLRRTAKDHFGRSECKNFDIAAHMKLVCYLEVPVEQVILKASHFLRIFGAFIIGFDELNMHQEEYQRDGMRIIPHPHKWGDEIRAKYRRKIVELLAKYCNNANFIELKFYEGNLTDEDEVRLRALLKGLQTFRLYKCRCSAQLVQLLPTCCPELRKLEITEINTRLNGLRQPFQKLTTVSFYLVQLDCADVEYFLKCNPQLKEFRLEYCTGPDSRIFQFIGKYGTEIETLSISYNVILCTQYPMNARYFDRLRNLKSITLCDFTCDYTVQVICDIVAAEIPLKKICVKGNGSGSHETILEKNLKKLKTLESLSWAMSGTLNCNHFINICKHLTELSQLSLDVNGNVSAGNLLELVWAAKKLQLLQIWNRSSNQVIDIDIYKSIVKVVEARAEKTHLEIRLYREQFRLDIPEELVAATKGSLKIVLIDPTCP